MTLCLNPFAFGFRKTLNAACSPVTPDTSITSRRGAEQSPPGGRGVVLGHVGSVVDGDPSDGWDIPVAGGLTSR